jgi:hypothetical protein
MKTGDIIAVLLAAPPRGHKQILKEHRQSLRRYKNDTSPYVMSPHITSQYVKSLYVTSPSILSLYNTFPYVIS